MNFNDFLSILGSARGAHRGSNEPCFPVLKTLLGPNGPKNLPRAPQGSPRPQKSSRNIDFLQFWLVFLRHLSCYFCPRFPGSVPSITRPNKNWDSGPIISEYPVTHFTGRVPRAVKHFWQKTRQWLLFPGTVAGLARRAIGYMYICIYIYICTYRYMYIYAYIYIYI